MSSLNIKHYCFGCHGLGDPGKAANRDVVVCKKCGTDYCPKCTQFRRWPDGTCQNCDKEPERLSPQPDNSHYAKLKMQPWDYIIANELNFFEGNVVKYVTRWRHKNGLDDLRKARVYIDELIRQEEAK